MEERKLPEGWHKTEKFGDVYISAAGIAWTTKREGNILKSVQVDISPADIIKNTAADRVKIARRQRKYRARVT